MGGSVGTSSSPWGSAMPWPFAPGTFRRKKSWPGSTIRTLENMGKSKALKIERYCALVMVRGFSYFLGKFFR